MKIINAKNVCQALPQTINYLRHYGKGESSRAGNVLVSPGPMITVTERPRERVLFSAERDANPFFHLAEAIWMLAGGHNCLFLDRYIKDFSKRYAETDGTLHDAYGWRWRGSLGFDQLGIVVDKLLNDPRDRQAVIQMWDGSADGENDLMGIWKSRPCNTTIFLRLRDYKLDMTICCRSNDMLWGCHGANAVHFSVLQEYLACRLDAEIGFMYQLSNNAHVYMDHLPRHNADLNDDRYDYMKPMAMFTDPETIDEDIGKAIHCVEDQDFFYNSFTNKWFKNTFMNAMEAHSLFKEKLWQTALAKAKEIEAPDWRSACSEWIQRRIK